MGEGMSSFAAGRSALLLLNRACPGVAAGYNCPELGTHMKITVVGAGAMGGSYGGLLAVTGHEVQLIDACQAHVDAINRDGLRVDGVRGDHRVRAAASSGVIGE